jgi:hypothetical protein
MLIILAKETAVVEIKRMAPKTSVVTHIKMATWTLCSSP